jgi:hypothetical protein
MILFEGLTLTKFYIRANTKCIPKNCYSLHTFPNLFYILPDGYVNDGFSRWGYYGRMTTKWTAKAIDVRSLVSSRHNVGARRSNKSNVRPIKKAGILSQTWTQDPQTRSRSATHAAIMSGYSLYAQRLVVGLSASMQQGISLKFRYELHNLLYEAPFCFFESLGIVSHCTCPEWTFSIGG